MKSFRAKQPVHQKYIELPKPTNDDNHHPLIFFYTDVGCGEGKERKEEERKDKKIFCWPEGWWWRNAKDKLNEPGVIFLQKLSAQYDTGHAKNLLLKFSNTFSLSLFLPPPPTKISILRKTAHLEDYYQQTFRAHQKVAPRKSSQVVKNQSSSRVWGRMTGDDEWYW